MSIPPPAIAHASTAPHTPVSAAKRPGSEKTPAPTIEPTTSPARVSAETLAGAGASVGEPTVMASAQMTPCASIAWATRSKPAELAPTT